MPLSFTWNIIIDAAYFYLVFCITLLLCREKFGQEVNSLAPKSSHSLSKTKSLVKSLMNRAELLLHVTIAAQSGLTRSISGTPADTPGTERKTKNDGNTQYNSCGGRNCFRSMIFCQN